MRVEGLGCRGSVRRAYLEVHGTDEPTLTAPTTVLINNHIGALKGLTSECKERPTPQVEIAGRSHVRA